MLKRLLAQKTTILLVAGIIILVILTGVGLKAFSQRKVVLPEEEVDLPFNADGPYALLSPRRDGNALSLNIKRVSDYDGISYELAYQSQTEDKEMVDRGVTGTLDMQNKKSEYTQEILFGTCSKGDTSDPLHCVFDLNVENGTLLLRIKQKPKPGDKVVKVYKINTTWHMQKPDVALGLITSADSHFSFKTLASRQDLNIVGLTLVNDLSGTPKIPEGKQILGKVYAFNVPTAKQFPPGSVTIELAQNPPTDAQIGQYIEKDNNWKILETKITGSNLTAQADSAGLFTVFANSPK
ncbi:hypothetical protein A2631_02645 [Candidatus Daviesbacteria bacterium RIFCSPHIGHO2_01_FULL_44_29]|uniref:Uncharacterized protein n=1 Tax=Candidatus Daviesbacteria bacterium RIFCSPHIGHO2_02_FULL_43_12 TaxID=1797776 RepID=A0A1F5KK34_9BACT|nr:MAG: hypothetical protein A2631_02645 [Candidatus Daviesbacteria bacterium RIFCSPHIGHO2_01_FULL_44_29]OGE40861.1 MAG: hypothetical protein A3E86_02705 [Candidatus Daviesbacteria bacterium RIFCSPHIGHO2_12_FULL_47_45]OGE41283.1 MAG: hypothetical protein A3D25_02040 [Candidatus Daviesbacteria bacterium RIFCSPHIGHO2_02_FULL_43_12]OGE69484.1 MAG: hypothetical protein A3B55_03780 [Candidatus Daviesbacteria bacterium RIFCSPLOWO2_01_FULL_43_15]